MLNEDKGQKKRRRGILNGRMAVFKQCTPLSFWGKVTAFMILSGYLAFPREGINVKAGTSDQSSWVKLTEQKGGVMRA